MPTTAVNLCRVHAQVAGVRATIRRSRRGRHRNRGLGGYPSLGLAGGGHRPPLGFWTRICSSSTARVNVRARGPSMAMLDLAAILDPWQGRLTSRGCRNDRGRPPEHRTAISSRIPLRSRRALYHALVHRELCEGRGDESASNQHDRESRSGPQPDFAACDGVRIGILVEDTSGFLYFVSPWSAPVPGRIRPCEPLCTDADMDCRRTSPSPRPADEARIRCMKGRSAIGHRDSRGARVLGGDGGLGFV